MGSVNPQNRKAGEETTQALKVGTGVRKVVSALVELTEGNDADCQSVRGVAFEGLDRGRHAGQGIDDPVAIDEVAHRGPCGWVPSSRAR